MHFSAAMSAGLHILFPLYIRDLGGSELTIGMYAGTAGAAAVLARIPFGYLLDHVGRRPAIFLGGVLNVIAWLGFIFADELGTLSFVFNLLNGIAVGALFTAFFTYASDITPETRRAEGVALFGIWGLLPDGLAPPLAEYVIARHGFVGYFVIAAAFAAISFAISLALPETRLRGHAAEGHAKPVPFRLWQSGLVGTLLTVLAFAVAMHGLFVFLAPYFDSSGRGAVSQFFVAYAAVACTTRVIGGRLPDRIGWRRILVPALAGYGMGLVLLPWANDWLAIAAAGGLCGLGHGYSFPILTVLAVSQGPRHARGRVVSLVTAMFDIGAVIAGPVLGGIIEVAGFGTMYRLVGATTIVAAILAAERFVPAARK